MFTIGEFSKVTGLTVKTLRFYHEEGLLAPSFVDPQTGYRHYDPGQVETARAIDGEVKRIIMEGYQRAHKALSENVDLLKKIAEALLAHETIDGEDIDVVLVPFAAVEVFVDLFELKHPTGPKRDGRE